jgi:uncharacterized coiled-coil protein SlyX
MTKFFSLDFHGTKYTVPKLSLFNLFEHQRDLFDATSYQVQSAVPLGVFEIFVEALETGAKVPVTKENAGPISVLAKEFWLEDLLSECSTLQVALTPELIATLSERITKLECQMSSRSLPIIAELKESIANHERQLENLECRIAALEPNLKTDVDALKSSSVAPVRPISPSKSLKEIEFPIQAARSLVGIVSYLTRKHGGHIHDKGIATITSKSVRTDDQHWHLVRNIADLISSSCFESRNEPGQWVCWDFHEKRVHPTHYTIRGSCLKSWMIESSLDFVNWTEIDRKRDNEDFKLASSRDPLKTASFAVSKSAECRFIQLTQTGKNHRGNDSLVIEAFEIFGTLLKCRK